MQLSRSQYSPVQPSTAHNSSVSDESSVSSVSFMSSVGNVGVGEDEAPTDLLDSKAWRVSRGAPIDLLWSKNITDAKPDLFWAKNETNAGPQLNFLWSRNITDAKPQPSLVQKLTHYWPFKCLGMDTWRSPMDGIIGWTMLVKGDLLITFSTNLFGVTQPSPYL